MKGMRTLTLQEQFPGNAGSAKAAGCEDTRWVKKHLNWDFAAAALTGGA